MPGENLSCKRWVNNLSVILCGACVPQCIAVCLWLLSLACSDSRACDERNKRLHANCWSCPSNTASPLKIQPSWLRYFRFCFPRQAGQRQHLVCVCVCVFPAVKSQPVRRTGPNPVSVQWKGIMECSHGNLCCQSSNLWQGKRTVYLTAANNFQRDQVLNCSHHHEFVFQLLS